MIELCSTSKSKRNVVSNKIWHFALCTKALQLNSYRNEANITTAPTAFRTNHSDPLKSWKKKLLTKLENRKETNVFASLKTNTKNIKLTRKSCKLRDKNNVNPKTKQTLSATKQCGIICFPSAGVLDAYLSTLVCVLRIYNTTTLTFDPVGIPERMP